MEAVPQSKTPHRKAFIAGSSVILFGGLALAAVVWSCWPMLTLFYSRWDSDPMYSHGYLVPLMAVGLVWLRGIPSEDRELKPSWFGLPLLLVGLTVRHYAAAWYFEWVEWIALLPIVAGVALTVSGWRLFRHLWPAIAFLVFMIPLPYRAEILIQQPMQGLVTTSSTFILQTLGLAAHSQGNVVVIGGTPIGIAEACSGLRMLTGFLALSVAAALIIDRDLIRKSLLLSSAVPIALACNIVRVTATSLVYAKTGSQHWQEVCHDGFGFLMPVMGGLLLCGTLKLLDLLFVDEAPVTETLHGEAAGEVSADSLSADDCDSERIDAPAIRIGDPMELETAGESPITLFAVARPECSEPRHLQR